MKDNKNNKDELVLARVFSAPREEVWKAWTEPERIMKWWGPKDFTCPFAQIDLREGGKYLSSMKAPDGKEYWNTGVFQEIVPNEKLVMTDSFADEKGNVVKASHYGMSDDFPTELQISVLFEDQDGKTKITLIHEDMPIGDLDDARRGWTESFDKLEELLEQKL